VTAMRLVADRAVLQREFVDDDRVGLDEVFEPGTVILQFLVFSLEPGEEVVGAVTDTAGRLSGLRPSCWK